MGNPAIDLTSLINVKNWMKIENAADDALLARIITSYSQWLQTQLGRKLVSGSYVETIDGGDERIKTRPTFSNWLAGAAPGGGIGLGEQGWAIGLNEIPVQAVSSVTIDGLTVPEGSDPGEQDQIDGWMLVHKRRVEMLGKSYGFRRGVQNNVIAYAAGYIPIGTAASFTGSIAGNVLTVTAVVAGGYLLAGQVISDATAEIAPGTYITSQQAGGTPGGVGTYLLSASQTVSTEAMVVVGDEMPFDIEQGVIDLVSYAYKGRDRIGQRSKDVGGSIVSFTSDPNAPSIKPILDAYGRINV